MYYDEIGIPTRQISTENPMGEKGGACSRITDPSDPDLPFSGAASIWARATMWTPVWPGRCCNPAGGAR